MATATSASGADIIQRFHHSFIKLQENNNVEVDLALLKRGQEQFRQIGAEANCKLHLEEATTSCYLRAFADDSASEAPDASIGSIPSEEEENTVSNRLIFEIRHPEFSLSCPIDFAVTLYEQGSNIYFVEFAGIRYKKTLKQEGDLADIATWLINIVHRLSDDPATLETCAKQLASWQAEG